MEGKEIAKLVVKFIKTEDALRTYSEQKDYKLGLHILDWRIFWATKCENVKWQFWGLQLRKEVEVEDLCVTYIIGI